MRAFERRRGIFGWLVGSHGDKKRGGTFWEPKRGGLEKRKRGGLCSKEGRGFFLATRTVIRTTKGVLEFC